MRRRIPADTSGAKQRILLVEQNGCQVSSVRSPFVLAAASQRTSDATTRQLFGGCLVSFA